MILFPMFPMFPMKPYDALHACTRVCVWRVMETIGNIGNIGNAQLQKGRYLMNKNDETRGIIRDFVRETVQRMMLADHLPAAMVIPQMQGELMQLAAELWGIEVAADYAKQISECMEVYRAAPRLGALAASHHAGRA